MSQPILEASTIREIMVGGDTPPMSDQYLANTTQRIVTLMFIDTFRSAFGKYDDSMRFLLKAAIESALQRYAATQYLTPGTLMLDFIDLLKKTPDLRPSGVKVNPIPALADDAPPRDKFVRFLRYKYQGQFTWSAGPSPVFQRWINGVNPLNDDSIEQQPKAVMNCWELVFYVAIRVGLLDVGPILAEYNSGSIGATLFERLDAYSKSKGAGGIKLGNSMLPPPGMKIKLGDLILVPLSEGSTGANRVHHVAAVVELNDNPEDIKVIELWRHMPGVYPSLPNWQANIAAMSRISTLDDIYAKGSEGKFSYVSLAP